MDVQTPWVPVSHTVWEDAQYETHTHTHDLDFYATCSTEPKSFLKRDYLPSSYLELVKCCSSKIQVKSTFFFIHIIIFQYLPTTTVKSKTYSEIWCSQWSLKNSSCLTTDALVQGLRTLWSGHLQNDKQQLVVQIWIQQCVGSTACGILTQRPRNNTEFSCNELCREFITPPHCVCCVGPCTACICMLSDGSNA